MEISTSSANRGYRFNEDISQGLGASAELWLATLSRKHVVVSLGNVIPSSMKLVASGSPPAVMSARAKAPVVEQDQGSRKLQNPVAWTLRAPYCILHTILYTSCIYYTPNTRWYLVYTLITVDAL